MDSLYPKFKFSAKIPTTLNPFYLEAPGFPAVLVGTGKANMQL